MTKIDHYKMPYFRRSEAGGGDDDAQPADVKPTLRVYLALEVTRVLLTLRGPILKLLGPVPW